MLPAGAVAYDEGVIPSFVPNRSVRTGSFFAMSKPENGLSRGQAQVWLKWVAESGVLDKLPPTYDDDGPSCDPASYARYLLAALRDPDFIGRPVADVLADVRRFRAWVERRQKQARQIILSERLDDAPIDDLLLRRGPEPSPRPVHSPPRDRARPDSSPPRAHPLFDEWLDG
jgi:hypothetical protein